MWQPPADELEQSNGWQPPADELEQPAQKEPSVFKQIGDAWESVEKNPFYSTSPVGWLNNRVKDVQTLSKKAGEGVESAVGEMFKQPNANAMPEALRGPLATAAGKFVEYAPDALMAVSPVETGKVAQMAVRPMEGALGFTKRFMNTGEGREAAETAAKVALEKGIMPWAGSAEGAALNAEKALGETGEAIGKIRESVGPQPIDKVFDSLESLRDRLTKGRTGGVWDAIHNRINTAQETLLGLLNKGEEISLNDVVEAKKQIGKSINWIADNVSQETNKQIVGTIEGGIEKILENTLGDLAPYKELKRTYGGLSSAMDALDNRLGSLKGNSEPSLRGMIAASGQLAAGSPLKAAATMGAIETLLRRGAGPFAKGINAVVTNPTAISSSAMKILGPHAQDILNYFNGNRGGQ